MDKLLRYSIDSWDEITQCKSNASRYLHLTCDQIVDRCLSGIVIRVEHEKYGCLFSYLVEGSGPLLTPKPDGQLFELSTDDVLMELEKFGFLVDFSMTPQLDDDQFSLLATASQLGYDKIRIMYVGTDTVESVGTVYERKANLVMFNIDKLPKWLDSQKVCTKDEFSEAVNNGYAINLTHSKGGLNHGHNWSFLNEKVLAIDNILAVAR